MVRFVLFIFFLTPLVAVGRFHEHDADEIDVEDGDMERYGDILSFQFPWAWDEFWRDRDLGFRATAGSLNQKNFYFKEETKFAADRYGAIDVSFWRAREQDLIEEKLEQELRIAAKVSGPFYAAIIGFSDSVKKWGDIGGAFEIRQSDDQSLSIHYLSIDHFYNEKELDFSERYLRKPWEVGGQWVWRLTPKLLTRGLMSYNSPLRWRRGRYGYQYEYQRSQFAGEVEGVLPSEDKLIGGISFDHKDESKRWGDKGDTDNFFYKGMNRIIYEAKIVYIKNLSEPARYLEISFDGSRRGADYSNHWLKGRSEDSLPEKESSDFAKTDLYGSIIARGKGLNYGILLGDISKSSGESNDHTNELKPLLAWEIQLRDRGFLYLNSTFDLDETVSQFPYRKGFPGWDGGNLMIMVAF